MLFGVRFAGNKLEASSNTLNSSLLIFLEPLSDYPLSWVNLVN